jgi:uncharacterized membrane protein YccC
MALSRRTKASIQTALAVTIVYAIAMAAGWEKPYWAAFAAAMISLDTAGQSLNKASLRMLSTLVGAAAALTLMALFPQERWAFMLGLSIYYGFCTYRMMGSEHPYFWLVSAFVSLIIVIDTSPLDSQGAFQTAVARVQETGMGILVYSIICIFLWPTSSRGALGTASRKLLAVQHRHYLAYRGLMAGQGMLEDARPLKMQEMQLLPQLGQAVSAARTESYEVWEVRHQWRSLHQQALILGQTLERWRETFPQLWQLAPARFLPNLDAVCEEIDHRFTQVGCCLGADLSVHYGVDGCGANAHPDPFSAGDTGSGQKPTRPPRAGQPVLVRHRAGHQGGWTKPLEVSPGPDPLPRDWVRS